jgi:RNA polymerase sigma-70 factor (ECF subfamily)
METGLSEGPDRSRCAELLLPHLNSAYNLARWLSRNDADAEDIVQDALERALKYASGLQGTNAKAWFLTIVRHACYDWIGRNRPAELMRGDNTDAIEAAVDSRPTPEESAIASADARALVRAIAALPVGFREVLLLREQEDMAYRDIARIVDIPIGTVMSRLARARGLLRRSPLLHAVAPASTRTAGNER